MIATITPLLRSELFETLTEEEISKLTPLSSEFAVIEDSFLFIEGHNASQLYIVTEGRIALQKAVRVPHGKNSRRTTITVCQPGEIVGWSALVEPYKYTLSTVAWETSRLIKVDSKMLRRALDMYPVMGYKVMMSLSRVMSRRLRQTTESLIDERRVSTAGLRL